MPPIMLGASKHISGFAHQPHGDVSGRDDEVPIGSTAPSADAHLDEEGIRVLDHRYGNVSATPHANDGVQVDSRMSAADAVQMESHVLAAIAGN